MLYDKMVELDADGVDFVHTFHVDEYPLIIESYTREQFKDALWYPKVGYKFWKMINGKKVYINEL